MVQLCHSSADVLSRGRPDWQTRSRAKHSHPPAHSACHPKLDALCRLRGGSITIQGRLRCMSCQVCPVKFGGEGRGETLAHARCGCTGGLGPAGTAQHHQECYVRMPSGRRGRPKVEIVGLCRKSSNIRSKDALGRVNTTVTVVNMRSNDDRRTAVEVHLAPVTVSEHTELGGSPASCRIQRIVTRSRVSEAPCHQTVFVAIAVNNPVQGKTENASKIGDRLGRYDRERAGVLVSIRRAVMNPPRAW
jgi:hypothetical protein